MRDDICTIPVSEVFEIKEGCPICRMYKTIEEHIASYILGDAMMESDVREETNIKGFCEKHFANLISKRGRLQLALILESHLNSVKLDVFDKKLFNSCDKKAQKAEKLSKSCFICSKIEWEMSRMIETVYRLYENEKDFRELFNSQPQFCLPHFELLIDSLDKQRNMKHKAEFQKNLTLITSNYIASLCEDVSRYCSMYDYRQAASGNTDWGNSKDSVERAIAFLSGSYAKD